jgi:hypothetical protein
MLSDPTVAHHAYNTHESHDHVKLLCDSGIKPRRREIKTHSQLLASTNRIR